MAGLDAKLGESFLATLPRLPGIRRKEAEGRDRAMELLRRLGLEEHAKKPAGELPYGLQRSVELGRALDRHPKDMILDEHGAGRTPAGNYPTGTATGERRDGKEERRTDK